MKQTFVHLDIADGTLRLFAFGRSTRVLRAVHFQGAVAVQLNLQFEEFLVLQVILLQVRLFGLLGLYHAADTHDK